MRMWVKIISLSVLVVLLVVSTAVQASRLGGGFTPSIGRLAWSPDGKSLAYAVADQGVFIVDSAGHPRWIADGDEFDLAPHWSPDGQYILSTIEVNDQAGRTFARVSLRGV